MPPQCLNCGAQLSGNFCSQCGQKSMVNRLGWKSLADEIRYFWLLPNGFFKTLFELAARPGRLYKNYLDGKRKSYYDPINFLLLSITAFLVIYQIDRAFSTHPSMNTATLFTNDAVTKAMVDKYRTLVEFVILPFTSLLILFFVAHPRLNYVEVFSVSFFGFSFLFILISFQYAIAILFGLNSQTNTFDIIALSLYIGWSLYAGYSFYSRYPIRFLVFRLILAFVACAILWFVMTRLIVKILKAMHMT